MTERSARVRRSIRSSIMAFGVAAVAYVAILGLLIRLALQPSSARLQATSRVVLEEYRESAMRATEMS